MLRKLMLSYVFQIKIKRNKTEQNDRTRECNSLDDIILQLMLWMYKRHRIALYSWHCSGTQFQVNESIAQLGSLHGSFMVTSALIRVKSTQTPKSLALAQNSKFSKKAYNGAHCAEHLLSYDCTRLAGQIFSGDC